MSSKKEENNKIEEIHKEEMTRKNVKVTNKQKVAKSLSGELKSKEKKVSNTPKTKKKKITKKKIRKKEYLPMFKTSDLLGVVVLTCFVSLFMGYFFGKKATLKLEDEKWPKGMQQIVDTFYDIKNNYYENVEDDTLIRGAIGGMLTSLSDPYATLIDNSSNTFDTLLNGKFDGVGIQVFNNDDGEIEIANVYENSPASEQGLQVGDLIIKFNDENVRKKTTSDLTDKIKEMKDKKFSITVLRDGKEITVKLNSDIVELKSVNSRQYIENNKKIGYISIDIFSLTTYEQFKKELEKLEKENIDSLIIDVRNNSGGHLSTVVNMVSLFLDKSHVIYQTQKKDDIEKFYSTGKVTKTYPIVVLVNENSASASELLAAALKEEYGATVIGKTTFGKGTVQELKTIKDDEYKFTTKKWLTPKGNWINDIGVTPDIEIEMDKNYITNPSEENDNQLSGSLRYLREK